MAEKGAHLTGTTYIRPSIFEIIAQESLASTLEPAFKKIFSILVSFNLERYGHILQWTDEGYLIFNVLLQRYYLKRYSASFSETFYGLKRVTVVNSTLKEKLTYKQQILSLILIVTFPYLKNKLAQLSTRYKFQEADGYISRGRRQKFFRKCVVKGHSILFITYETLVLYNYVLYISEKSMYPSPLLRPLSVTLTYADPQSTLTIAELLRKIKYNSFTFGDGWNIFQRIVTGSLELGAFFLQFLSWWSQENYDMDIMSLPAPPPPKVPNVAQQYKGICPLCCKPHRIHTVLMVSGYVFCYQCILSEIRMNKRCPVTHYPAKEDDLIRLYIE
ncbi:peroxisome assembly protein 12 [Temnothorax curvispinosus]|uniref:Peroxisome assembly protein 12 n=1 Tax=Temnothorax curvispinosus TaxID=300111 RepID=A0A6J1QC95_9HYME|nr:peroxisome assembly protein 12 [Temnothorax curvispinosus]XP_024880023.1 peroxisome assembly protein 12 [Temnothorax curvispinosus]